MGAQSAGSGIAARANAVVTDKLTWYHIFLAVIGLVGWTIVALDGGMFIVTYPLMMKEFNFGIQTVGYIFAAAFGSGFVASLVVGPLLDTLGRKAVFQAILFITAIGSFLTGVAGGVSSLIAFRILAQAPGEAEYPVGSGLITESVPARHRGWMLGVLAAGWPLGTALAATIALWLVPHVGWRGAFMVIAATMLFIIPVRFFVKESPRFEDVATLRREARKRAASAHVAEEEVAREITTRYAVAKDKAVKPLWHQLFSPELNRNNVLCFVYIIGVIFGYGLVVYYAPYWLTTGWHMNLTSATKLIAVGSYVSIAGYLSQGWLSDRIGVRESKILYALLAIIVTLYMTFVARGVGEFAPAYVVWNFFGVGLWGAMPRLFNEIYPTRVRGTGAAFASSATWLGWLLIALLGPVMIGAWGFDGALKFVGLGMFAVAVIALLLMKRIPPGLELEEIIA